MKKYLLIVPLVVMAAFSLTVFSGRVDANPSQFIESNATATTSVTYMTAGTATTTEAFDTQSDGTSPADSAILLIQAAASSTATVYNIDIQYSHNNIDWFATNQGGLSYPVLATTTPSLAGVQQFTYTFASSTINRVAVTNANSATSSNMLVIPTPTRYVRAKVSLAPSSAGGAVWVRFIAKKQNR